MLSRWPILSLALVACTDSAGATNALQSAGFSDIRLTGYEPFGCGENDGTSTGFRAKNPSGKSVSGVVCCGLFFKGCTIRW